MDSLHRTKQKFLLFRLPYPPGVLSNPFTLWNIAKLIRAWMFGYVHRTRVLNLKNGWSLPALNVRGLVLSFRVWQDLTGEIHCHTGPSFRGNVFQKLGLFKVIPFVRKGAKSSLEHHHIWRLRKQHATETAWQEFEPAWTFQKTQPEYVHS